MITPELLKKLSEPSLKRFLPFLVFDWLQIAACLALFHFHQTILGFFGVSVFLGLVQHALPILGHEAVHHRITRNHFLNEWIGNIFCFFPVGLTVSAYRSFHHPHHLDPFGKTDPELPLRRAIPGFSAPFTLRRGLKIALLSYFGFSLKSLFAFISMIPKGDASQRRWMLLFWGMVILGVSISGTWAYLALWIVSLATTYFTSIQVQGWYEHGLPDLPACRYALPNMLFRIIVPHNIWLHYEHHKYPSVPFYNLETVRELDNSDRVYALNSLIGSLHESTSNPMLKAS